MITLTSPEGLQWLTTPEDLQWLKETHLLKAPPPDKYKDFKLAAMYGSINSPYIVNLYMSEKPNLTDSYYRIKFMSGETYAIGIELDCNYEAVYGTLKYYRP